jgi:apolipoprotein N-acyltransferase
VNVTNDAWYGDSAGPRQHLSMTRFRSIEEGLPSARSANTGISALFDSYGREVVRASLDEPAALNAALPQSADRTIYSHIGDLLFSFSVIFIFCGAVISDRPLTSQNLLVLKYSAEFKACMRPHSALCIRL